MKYHAAFERMALDGQVCRSYRKHAGYYFVVLVFLCICSNIYASVASGGVEMIVFSDSTWYEARRVRVT